LPRKIKSQARDFTVAGLFSGIGVCNSGEAAGDGRLYPYPSPAAPSAGPDENP
jgi:hypothetical protein